MAAVTASLQKRFPGFSLAADLTVDGIVALVGGSGSGKTTILRCLAGLETPDGGWIRHGEEVWFPNSLPVQARRVGFIFNDHALFPHLTVRQNIRYGAPNDRCVEKWLDLMHLRPVQDHRPHQLSAGQQQRVAIARALVPKPRLLLMDEPFSSLDPHLKEHLYEEFLALLREKPIPTVLVTHDLQEASRLAEKILVLHEGKVLQEGTPREILFQPRDPVVARLAGIRNQYVSPVRAGLAWGGTLLKAEAQGPSAAWCIRAEQVELPLSPGGENEVEGIVRESHLLGSAWRVVMEVGEEKLEACWSVALADWAQVQVGSTLRVRIPREAIHLFPAETAVRV